MRILFVGEGPNDVGTAEFAPKPHSAAGVVATLFKRACPDCEAERLAYYWRQIPVLNAEKKRRGLAAKVASAIVLASVQKCQGTICVVDRGGDDTRLSQMEEGAISGARSVEDGHKTVCGVARDSIEAWTLGAPSAIAKVLDEPLTRIRQEYKLSDVEEFNQNSGKPEKRPKDLLAKIAALKHHEDNTAFRERVAEHTDVGELIQNCPTGFKPFAEKLKAAFGP